MFRTSRVTTLVICISLLALMLTGIVFAETMGQRVIRLRRESEAGQSSSYTRSEFSRTGETVKKPEEEIEEPAEMPDAIEEVIVDVPELASPIIASEPVEKIAPVAELASVNPNDPLCMVPADALVCIRINDFNRTLVSLDKYLTGVSPMSVNMLATQQIGSLIGNPMLTGIDFSGDVIVFVKFTPGMGGPSI